MNPALGITLYLVIGLLSVPLFARVEFSKAVMKKPELLADTDSPQHKALRTEATLAGIIYGVIWPGSLIAVVVWIIINGLSFGIPKELEREMKLREARQIIADYEKKKEEGL